MQPGPKHRFAICKYKRGKNVVAFHLAHPNREFVRLVAEKRCEFLRESETDEDVEWEIAELPAEEDLSLTYAA